MIRILAVGLLLGARHATDPDHLTAVSTLVLTEPEGGRRAAVLGALWGAGHSVTLLLIGIPVILVGSTLPDALHIAAEVAIGTLIVALAARLLLRWRRGYFHMHAHEHDGVVHVHPHFHESTHATSSHGHGERHHREHDHGHRHAHDRLVRSPLAAFGLGLVHGVGGSAFAGVLVAAAASSRASAVATLIGFACSVAVAMAATAFVLGHVLSRDSVTRTLPRLIPSAGVLALLFGLWYALASLSPPVLVP